MTNTYTSPSSMTLIVSEDGSVETRDNAIMRELKVHPVITSLVALECLHHI